MQLSSSAFSHEGMIPALYTCQGNDCSPPLDIEGVPESAQSLVLIVDDPDAPMGTWIHWVAYDIPVVSSISEGEAVGTQGVNDFWAIGYGGPCPPSGVHRYFFKLYALDCALDIKEGATKGDIEHAMEDHVIAKAELIGLYEKA